VVLADIVSIYRPTPEPAPDGPSVDPLGEAFGPSVFPDGLMVLLGAVVVAAPRLPGLLPAPMPVVPPVVVPVLPLMDEPPVPEPAPAEPPAAPPPACANANVLDSDSTVARAMVVIFIVDSSFVMSAIQRAIDILCSGSLARL
jgi:hypothetical protein